MIVACVAVFAVMVIAGVPVFQPSSTQLIGWGANDGARVMLRHDYWRLATSVFVHGGLIHLAVNMWSLMVVGPLVERIYGPLAFAVIYLSAGIGGAIASAVIPPMRVSVGASGAICGVLGALMAFLLVNRRTIPPSVLKLFRSNLLGIVAFMAVLGVMVPNIDQAAHLGGLGTGFVSGLLLSRPWPVVPSRWITARRLAMTAVIAAGLPGIAVAATQWGETSVPAARRLEDLVDQIKPPYDEFYSINKAISHVDVDADGDHDSAGQEGASRAVRELAVRGIANLDRFRRATTTDPELRAVWPTRSSRRKLGRSNNWRPWADSSPPATARTWPRCTKRPPRPNRPSGSSNSDTTPIGPGMACPSFPELGSIDRYEGARSGRRTNRPGSDAGRAGCGSAAPRDIVMARLDPAGMS